MILPRTARKDVRGIGRSLARVLSVVALFAFVVASASSKQPPAAKSVQKDGVAAPAANLEKLTVDDLIDLLQEVAEGGEQIGLDQRVKNEFLAWNLVSFYSRQHHGQPWSKNSPVMRELVSRGLQSLPKLLDHLDDKRPTKLVARPVIFLVRDHDLMADEEIRQKTTTDFVVHTEVPPNPTGFEKRPPDYWRYPVKVGDLCYVAVGQIVNRNYRLLRKQEPTVLLNSPVHIAAVAAACRREWAGLTAEKHKASLINDCLDHLPGADPTAAMIRLHFYYPREGEKIIVEHIRRPFFEKDVAYEFCQKQLLSITENEYARIFLVFSGVKMVHEKLDAILYRFWAEEVIDEGTAIQSHRILHGVWKLFHELLFRRLISVPMNQELSAQLDRFEKTHGKQNAKEIPITLMKCVVDYEKHTNPSLDLAVGAFKAKTLLADRFPDRESYRYQFINRTTISGADRFLRDLPDHSSANIDQAIYEVFQRMSQSENTDQGPDPWLAHICIDKLAGKGHDPELRAYLERRIEWARRNPKSESTIWVLQLGQEGLAKLKK